MSVDWDTFDANVDQAMNNAEKRTSDALAAQGSSLTRLTDDEMKQLFPTPADLKALNALMKIVKSADSENRKTQQIIENVESVASAVVKIVGKLA